MVVWWGVGGLRIPVEKSTPLILRMRGSMSWELVESMTAKNNFQQ